MSLILDALRKSEAERRRGQAPDLYAAAPIARRAHPIDPLRLWPVLVFAVLVAAAGFVFWRGPSSPPSATKDSAAADGSAVATPVGEAVSPGAHSPSSAARAASVVSTTATPSQPPSATKGAELPPLRGETASRPSAATLSLAAPLPPLPVSIPPDPAAAPVGDEEPDLPPLAVLEPTERAALPPLKLSMHVWASEPGKRFAIIDGQRVTEGSSLGNSVVAQIRRDGVVLDVGGRRFLLPRP
jgi:general secretion pathway protein B